MYQQVYQSQIKETQLLLHHGIDKIDPSMKKSKQRFFDCYVGPKALTFQTDYHKTAEREFSGHSIQSGDPEHGFLVVR